MITSSGREGGGGAGGGGMCVPNDESFLFWSVRYYPGQFCIC